MTINWAVIIGGSMLLGAVVGAAMVVAFLLVVWKRYRL